MHRSSFNVSSVLVLICILAISPPSFSKGELPLTLKVSYSSAYDDNILNYSNRDLDRFENNAESYPSEITTTDDWINTFNLRAYNDFNLGRKFKFRPYYSYRISLNAVNQVKNLQSHYFLARFSYKYRAYLYMQYSYVPGYYLRIYRDRDLDEYHTCDFNSYRPSLRLRFRQPPYQIEGQLGREFIYYNKYFTEYDSEGTYWGIKGSYKTPINLNLSLGYQLKTSDNVGFDQNIQVSPAELVEDTEYGDSSYEEDRFRINLSYPLPLKAPWDWELGLDYQRRIRYYQSELNLSDDPFHTGREDDRILITPSIKFSSSFDLDFKLEYTYDQRETDSPEPSVSSVKNFKNHTIELTVTYQIL